MILTCPDSKSPPKRCDDKASVSVCLFFCCVDSLEHPNPSKSLAIGRSFGFRNSTCPHQQGYWTLSRPSLCCQPSRLSEQFCPPTGEQHSCSKIISKIRTLGVASRIGSMNNHRYLMFLWIIAKKEMRYFHHFYPSIPSNVP